MANIAGSYDPNAEANEFDQLPAGTYRAKITESEIVEISSRSNKGRCLKLTWQVETGPHDGRLIWQRINMWAENMDNIDKVISIANGDFASIRQATGKLVPQDSAELHHIPCMITVAPQKNSPQYNEVKSVKPVGGAQQQSSPAPAQRQAPPVTQSRPAANAGASAPWRKSATAA